MRITKRSAYSALAGVGVLLGAAGISAAATGNDSNTTPAAVVQQAYPTVDDETNEGFEDEANEGSEDGEHEGRDEQGPEVAPDYTSSVQTTPEDEATETGGDEADEEAALAALASVTPDEASAAALAAEMVVIDAGNGEVLAPQAD